MNWIKSLTLFALFLSAAPLFGDDATNQFNSAKNTFDNKQYEPARAGFENFLARFPTHAKANEARFYLAESLMYLRQYSLAETHFHQLVAPGLTDQFARAALFRIAEIPYMQGQLDIAKSRLEEFVEKLPHDINLQFVLYYLGDIAMRSNTANSEVEAEFYFDQANRMFPDGAKLLDSKLGLAWAKNKLGKLIESNAIYSELMSSTNPAIAEQATYQYGMALFERRSYQESITLLTNFQRQYPTSSYLVDSQRIIARSKGRLNDYDGALQILAQINPPTTDDMLMRVRLLYSLKRMLEAKTALDEAKRVAGTAYRDEIALLESAFLSDQKDWRAAIALLEQVLVPQFNETTNRMVINYFSFPVTSGTKKLSEEATFRACSFLALAYANNGDTAKANALLTEMQVQSALSGNVRLTSICTDTVNQLAAVKPATPGRGGSGGYANRNTQQWSPNGQSSTSRNPTLMTSGTDLDKFWNAERLYLAKNYESTAQQLEQILLGYYNQIAVPPLYSILYNITGAEGTLDENTFARACSLLALSKAQLGDMEQANAVVQTFASRIRMNNSTQQQLLQETYNQLTALTKGGGTASGSASLLSDTEQRRLLREAKDFFRTQRYDQTDAKLTELVASNPAETVLTEALFLQGKAKYGLGRERESIVLVERIIDEFPESKEYPEAVWSLGLYYESGGDSLQAVEYFQILADKFLNFKHIDGALYYLAVDDLTNGSGRKATTYLSKVYKNNRNGLYWSHAAWALAYEAYKKKQYTVAENYIREILRHPPDKVVLDRALYLRGELALQRNDYESAFLAFREVGKLCADSPLSNHATRNAQLAGSKVVRQ